MPNRILKESIKSSHEIDQLDFFQECMFYRLIVSADDFGRYYGDPVLLKSFLFPRKENIQASDIDNALSVMENLGLIRLYLDEKGDHFLQFVSWLKHQQKRSNKSKFPDPVSSVPVSSSLKSDAINLQSSDINCLQVDSKCPRKRERERERDRESGTTTITRNETGDIGDDGDLLQIQNDHNEILDAAQAAGFPTSTAAMDKIIDLYAEFGKETVLAGISACVEHNVIKPAYLRKCCQNISSGESGKTGPAGKRNPFDDMLEAMNDDKA